jgi:beta-glucanase (GH16 family)
MSDEFNTPGRSFADGDDPTWTALDKNDYTNNALHYYSPSNVNTDGGFLNIRTEPLHVDIIGLDDATLSPTHETKNFRSGMVQSWNKFCFTGGIVEASVTLPGDAHTGGLWPAFWLLGNLARHTYVGSSSNIWPWSMTSTCDPTLADAQLLSPCLKTSHYGMAPGVGRGAPEIDIFEVQPGPVLHNTNQFSKMSVGQPFTSASLQVAPGKRSSRPGNGNWPAPWEWYQGLQFGPNSTMNINFFGSYNHFKAAASAAYDYWSDAVSQNRQLTASHFETAHTFRLEWEPPSDIFPYGYLHWFLDGELILAINGTSINPVTHAEIPSEPSYIIFNTAVSKEWGFPTTCPMGCNCDTSSYDCLSPHFAENCGFSPGFCSMMKDDAAPEFKIDWVRVYQDPTNPTHKVGCSTPERPTREWIEGHADKYKTEDDSAPLKKVRKGGGACSDDLDPKKKLKKEALERESENEMVDDPERPSFFRDICGGSTRGTCTKSGTCSCTANHTGPWCLSADKSNGVEWDAPDSIFDLGFVLPSGAVLLFIVFIGFGAALAVICGIMRGDREKVHSYEAIPELAL